MTKLLSLVCFFCYFFSGLEFSQGEEGELWKSLIHGICSWCIKISKIICYIKMIP